MHGNSAVENSKTDWYHASTRAMRNTAAVGWRGFEGEQRMQ